MGWFADASVRPGHVCFAYTYRTSHQCRRPRLHTTGLRQERSLRPGRKANLVRPALQRTRGEAFKDVGPGIARLVVDLSEEIQENGVD